MQFQRFEMSSRYMATKRQPLLQNWKKEKTRFINNCFTATFIIYSLDLKNVTELQLNSELHESTPSLYSLHAVNGMEADFEIKNG